MKERPILFQANMVRALLDGSKTQTRRIFKAKNGGVWPNSNDLPGMKQIMRNCPYGQPGARLWVRETWAYHLQALSASNHELSGPWVYCADGHTQHRLCDRWRPSIHMPRAASRITLEITGVRVERLQNISEADAIAEGIERGNCNWRDYMDHPFNDFTNPRRSYRSLWESINGLESWAANPWVWVVEFKRVEGATA